MKLNIILSVISAILVLIGSLIMADEFNMLDSTETLSVYASVSAFMLSIALISICKLFEEVYGDRIKDNGYATKILKYGLPAMFSLLSASMLFGIVILELGSTEPSTFSVLFTLAMSTMLGTVLSCVTYPKMNEYIIKRSTVVFSKKKPISSKIKCSKCEATFPKNVKFCPNCGTAVENKNADQ